MKTDSLQTLTAFEPLASHKSTTLILGSMPGVASLEQQQYYAHPRNAFWFIMQSLFGTAPAPQDYQRKMDLLQQANIALWDVLMQCRRPGSLDSNIDPESVVCNNFHTFMIQHKKLTKIAFNGKAAEQLFRRHVLPDLSLPTNVTLLSLPSSSPAMATFTKEQKAQCWREKLLS